MELRQVARRILGIALLSAMLLSACIPAAAGTVDPAPAGVSNGERGIPLQSDPPADPPDLQDPPAVDVQVDEPQAPADRPDQPPAEADPPAEPPQQLTLGPDTYPQGVNPLTGLPVGDPALLQDCPLLVAVSNFPPSSRGSLSGLSVAAQVWETFIGEGMTRFLAVFYGDYAAQLQGILDNPLVDGANFAIGPIRSGRVAFEDIKMLFPGATLVTAGASPEVAEQLTGVQTAYGSDPEDLSSAGLEAAELRGLPCRHGKPPSFAGLAFDPAPPEGGQPAASLRIVYNIFNQVGWEYDAAQGAYLRSQDKADGSGILYPILENLTGEQLAFENVLVLFADHHFVKPTIIEINLMFVEGHRGLLFRDGQVYPVVWSTLRGQLRLADEAGNPLPLRPGQTFLEVVSYQTTWNADQRIVRYHNP